MQVGADVILLVAVVVVCATAPLTHAPMRVAFHVAVIGGGGVAAFATGLPATLTAIVVSVITLAALVSSSFAAELRRVRLAAEEASNGARRRMTLLAAMRQLQGLDSSGMAEHAVTTLRSLGFPAVELLLNGADGLHSARSHVSQESELDRDEVERAASRALELANEAEPEGGRVTVGTATVADGLIAAPICAGGTPVGVIVAASPTAGAVHPDALGTVQVVAGHLGAAFATERQVARQRELLERMGNLEELRRMFLGQISDELRSPLAQAREACDGLMQANSAQDATARGRYLTMLTERTADLRATIDTLLDFSQTQSEANSAQLAIVELEEVLDAVALVIRRRSGMDDCRVQVDRRLLAGAIELLFGGAEVDVHIDDDNVWLTATDAHLPSRAELARSLWEQLLVGAGAALEEGPPPRIGLRRVAEVGA